MSSTITGNPLRYLSVCSGIEAATVAWAPLGWRALAFSEIDRFPCAVLAHHYPSVPNWGDITAFKEWPDADVDVLIGGTPCQSFSVAGLRAGLADPRGNLTLTYLAVADRYRPRWVVWENVPGVLSSTSHDAPVPCPPPKPVDLGCDGAEVEANDEYDAEEQHAFNCFLAGLSELGYGWAYRSLDAQYFNLAQRRERVFVVGHLGDWRRAAAVLFERASLSGHPAPCRETRQGPAGTVGVCTPGGGGIGDVAVVGALTAAGGTRRKHGHGWGQQEFTNGYAIPVALRANTIGANAGRNQIEQTYLPVAFSARMRGDDGRGYDRPPHVFGEGVVGALDTVKPHCVAFKASHYTRGKDGAPSQVVPPLSADADKGDQDTVIAFDTTQITHPENRSQPQAGDPCHPLAAQGHAPTIAFRYIAGGDKTTSLPITEEYTPTLDTSAKGMAVAFADLADPVAANQGRTYTREGTGNFRLSNVAIKSMRVRRLTPRECERLQGFPDDYTLIPYKRKPVADGPRYKALGNSMAVPVIRWIGERIALVDVIPAEAR